MAPSDGTDPRSAQLESWVFDYSTAFEPEDRLAHFVVSLGAAHNDLVLTHRFLLGSGEGDLLDQERQALLRLVLSQIWETHLLVEAAGKDPAVATFLERVGAQYASVAERGAEMVDALMGKAGATAPRLRNVLRTARNATNHYPKPGDAGLAKVLAGLAGARGAFVVGPTNRHTRALFADEVMVRFALEPLSAGTDEEVKAGLVDLMMAAADSVEAILNVAVIAIDMWLAEHGATEGPMLNDPRSLT